jgi:hypothetical protein
MFRIPRRRRSRRRCVASAPKSKLNGLACEWLEQRWVLSAAFDLVGLTSLRSDPLFQEIEGRGPNGQPVGVAVLDTGVEAWHPDLRNNFVAWYDAIRMQGPSLSLFDAFDRGGHGTHVSGTAVSSNPAYGVATGAGLVGVRVLPQGNEPRVGDPVLHGLQWVAANYQRYNIRVVNMSLGYGDNNDTASLHAVHPISQAIDRLEALGITVVTASGNSYAREVSTGAAFPAITSTISVGSVWPSSTVVLDPAPQGAPFDRYKALDFRASPDQLSGFSQRSTLPNQLMAPGSDIVSTSARGGAESKSGTSMASPMVAGVVALMQDAAVTFGGRWLQPAEVLSILRDTADRIMDAPTDGNNRVPADFPSFLLDLPETGLSYLRINAHRALQRVRQLLLPAQDANAVISTAVAIPNLDGTRVFTVDGRIGSDGRINLGANDIDLYKLTLVSPGVVTAAVAPVAGGSPFDPYLRLFDSAGRQVAANNDFSGVYPSLESVRLAAGTYYIGVSSFNNSGYNVVTGGGAMGGQSQGDYRLSVSLGNRDPNGVLRGAATFESWALPRQQYYYLTDDIGTDPGPTDGDGSRLFVGGNDVDMYEVLAVDTGVLRIWVGSVDRLDGQSNPATLDTYVRVFDAAGTELAANDDDGFTTDSYVEVPVSKGQRLFVAISESMNRSYSATDPFRPYREAGTGLYDALVQVWNRDANGSAYDATVLAGTAETVPGMVGSDAGVLIGEDGSRDVDFYLFSPEENGVLDFTVTSPDGTLVPSVSLWRWFPDEQEVFRLAESTAESVTQQVYVAAGEYYFVSVTGEGNSGYQWNASGTGLGGDTGNYQLVSRLRPESDWWLLSDEVIGSPAIRDLMVDEWADGFIGGDGDLLRGATDVDLWRFVAPRDGTVSISTFVDFEYGSDTFLRVFDAAGNELAFNDDWSTQTRSSRVLLEVVAGATYYVGISGWGPDGDLRAYTPTGILSTVQGSIGGYFLSVVDFPAVVITRDGSGELIVGDTAALTFTMTEPVMSFTLQNIAVSGGMVTGLQGSGTTYTVTFVPARQFQGIATIAVPANRFTDLAGNGNAPSNIVSIQVDTIAPLIIRFRATPDAATLGIGDSLLLEAEFSERVTPGGSLLVRLDSGPLISLVADASGLFARGTYTTQAGEYSPDLDALAIVSNGTLRNARGNPLDEMLPLPAAGLAGRHQITVDARVRFLSHGVFSTDPTLVYDVASQFRRIPITFSTPVSGLSVNTLSLSLNGQPLPLRGARLEGNGTTYVLVLPATRARPVGIYTLSVGPGGGVEATSNGAGASTQVSLHWGYKQSRGMVPDAPAAVAVSQVFQAGRRTFAVLTWQPPSGNGGGPLTRCVVQYRIAGSTRWLQLRASLPGSATSATISGIGPGRLYEFRVAAANAAGLGAFSELRYGGMAAPGSSQPVTPRSTMLSPR